MNPHVRRPFTFMLLWDLFIILFYLSHLLHVYQQLSETNRIMSVCVCVLCISNSIYVRIRSCSLGLRLLLLLVGRLVGDLDVGESFLGRSGGIRRTGQLEQTLAAHCLSSHSELVKLFKFCLCLINADKTFNLPLSIPFLQLRFLIYHWFYFSCHLFIPLLFFVI